MEPNTADKSTTTNDAASGKQAPFPVAGQGAGAGAPPAKPSEATAAAAAAAPVVDSLIKRATQRAHEAVDGVSDRISSTVDGLQGGVSRVGDSRDEWVESARDAIRQHPFAALGGAVLIGLALSSLMSSRDR